MSLSVTCGTKLLTVGPGIDDKFRPASSWTVSSLALDVSLLVEMMEQDFSLSLKVSVYSFMSGAGLLRVKAGSTFIACSQRAGSLQCSGLSAKFPQPPGSNA